MFLFYQKKQNKKSKTSSKQILRLNPKHGK